MLNKDNNENRICTQKKKSVIRLVGYFDMIIEE